jgi:serine/threonine-protein kinase
MAGAISRGELLKDRYRLERTLGRGGMAVVWLGHDEVLDRPVAVKVLSDTIASDPGFLARFRREARTAAALSHPNLTAIYDFSEEGERPYLVMQFVPGENLASRLERGERLDCDQLARELLDALSHIHAVGILHRDIKPANVIVEPDGTAKLIDFGIALPRDATSLTSTGLVLGTERYAAPEVLAGGPATERSDLYSCGLVLRSCRGRRSQALRALIAAMTSKAPRGRPLSAKHALEELNRPDTLGAPTESFVPPFAEPPELLPRAEAQETSPAVARSGSKSSRRKVLAALLGLLAVGTVLALIASNGDDRVGGGSPAAKVGKGGPASVAAAGSGRRGSVEEAPSPRVEAPDTKAAAPSGTDPGRGAALNEEGFVLIQAGEYEASLPVLEEAVNSFPEGSEDLNYAYALFNLGHALRLSGSPEQAIPVLERRLEIPNQQDKVREELEAAYAETGTSTSLEREG